LRAPFPFIPLGGCWFSNAAVDDLRSLCYAVLHRVANTDHNLQAHCFVKVDSPVQPGDVTNGLRSEKKYSQKKKKLDVLSELWWKIFRSELTSEHGVN